MKYIGSKFSFFSACLISVTIFSCNRSRSPQNLLRPGSAADSIYILRDGEPVPQRFRARAPIPDYSPGETAGFIITDTLWRHPFWRVASVREGWAYCDFCIGCDQDIGRHFQIRGVCVPTNCAVPPDGELRSPVSGRTFYGPAIHERY